MNFKEIIGNEKNKVLLNKIVQNNSTVHSYLFVGIQGIGKKLIAREFAKMLLCGSEVKPCNKCKSCIGFNSFNNLDCYEIEPDDKSIKIEQIRDMQSSVYEKPIISSKKIYIIDDAEKMTFQAQNCLLKILEEPPEYVVIILITSNENKLFNTIKSRTVKFCFDKIKNEDIKKYITEKKILKEVNDDIVSMCEGSILKVTKIKNIIKNYNFILDFMKKIEEKDLIECLNSFKNKDREKVLELLECMNIIMCNRQKFDYIEYIEEAKLKIESNINIDMIIDNLVFNIIGGN